MVNIQDGLKLKPEESVIPTLQPDLTSNTNEKSSEETLSLTERLNEQQLNKKVIDVSFSIGNPENPNTLDPNSENLYKKTTYSDGSHTIEAVSEKTNEVKNEIAKDNAPKEEADTKSINNETNTNVKVDLNADSDTSKVPLILQEGFSIKNRIKSVNNNLDEKWKTSPAYLALTQKVQEQIEHNNDMKKMYRYIAFDNVSGVHNLIESGKIKAENINDNDGLALRMVVSTGSLDMAKTLFDGGGSPFMVDPKQCYTKEMADLVKEEQYKVDHPVMSTLRESVGLGMPKPRFG